MKIILIFLVCFWMMLPKQTYSQIVQPSLLFAAGGDGTDYGYDIALDENENVYVIGQFAGAAHFNELFLYAGFQEYIDIFIVKYDPMGNILWVNRCGGPGEEADFTANIEIKNDGVYITSTFEDSINFNTPSSWNGAILYSSGGIDVFVAKYSLDGDFLWAKRMGGKSDDYGSNVSVSNEGVYVGGEFRDSLNFSDNGSWSGEILHAADSNDIFLAKFSLNGDVLWTKRAGGVGADAGRGVHTTTTGVYLTGWFEQIANFNSPSSFGSNELIAKGDKDIFVAKYNTEGNFLWAKRAGGFGEDVGISLYEYNNELYLTGNFQSTANFNTPSQDGSNEITSVGNDNFFIAKYTANGDFLWAKTNYGGNSFTSEIGVNENGLYITGSFEYWIYFTPAPTPDDYKLVSHSGSDIFVAKYSHDGVYQWSRRGGGNGSDNAYGLALTIDGVFATGRIADVANFNTPSSNGTNELHPNPFWDVFVVKFWETSVGLEEQTALQRCKVSPNPSLGEFMINLPSSFLIRDIEITDLFGKTISFEFSQKLENQVIINLNTVKSGAYYLILTNSINEKYTQFLIID